MSFGSDVIRLAGGPVHYYTNYTTTNLYVAKSFGGNVNTITISNDSSSDAVQVSYDGATLEGELNAGETVTLDVSSRSIVYVKGTAGGGGMRIWGW